MTSGELINDSRSAFPSLKKPWFGRDVIECSDTIYDLSLPHQVYLNCLDAAWAVIVSMGVEYHETYPDCDDYSDMLKGLAKLEWWKSIQSGLIKAGSQMVIALINGYNPRGENHAYLYFRSDMGRFIRDYGETLPITGYRPMRMKF